MFGNKNTEIPEYGLLYFDHLLGEFSLEKRLSDFDPEDEKICEETRKNREENKLTWNEIYTFQLILLKYHDFETLKSKIVSLRIKFQALSDIAEYNEYMALRAVDLKKTTEEDDATMVKLRADLRYLIDEFYLRYAYTSAREELRTSLLRWGAYLTLFFFIIAGAFAFSQFYFTEDKNHWYSTTIFPFVTIIAVVFTGTMGAFVSMQQRLQKTPHHGDPIHNLALLTHGFLSIFLAPLSGAIFAAILYLFFAGQVLDGTIFPEMTEGPAVSQKVGGDGYMTLKNFILSAHPATTKDYALLLIWSFVAGFAERFVPDTLMRIVSQKKTNETTQT